MWARRKRRRRREEGRRGDRERGEEQVEIGQQKIATLRRRFFPLLSFLLSLSEKFSYLSRRESGEKLSPLCLSLSLFEHETRRSRETLSNPSSRNREQLARRANGERELSQTWKPAKSPMPPTTTPLATTRHCCCRRSCASLTSTSAAAISMGASRHGKRPQSLSGRAFGLAERRREPALEWADGHVVAAASLAPSPSERKNLAVFGLKAASPLPARRARTTAALPNSSSDLPPAPVRSQQYSTSEQQQQSLHGPPASLSAAAALASAGGRRLVAASPRSGNAAFAAAAGAAGGGIRLRPRGALSAVSWLGSSASRFVPPARPAASSLYTCSQPRPQRKQNKQLLFLATIAAAIAAAAASLVANNTRSCECCKGFGVCRCPVCGG